MCTVFVYVFSVCFPMYLSMYLRAYLSMDACPYKCVYACVNMYVCLSMSLYSEEGGDEKCWRGRWSVLQQGLWGMGWRRVIPPLQYTTVCSTMQHTATHCNTLQYTATHCNTLATSLAPTSVRSCILLVKPFLNTVHKDWIFRVRCEDWMYVLKI